MIYDIESHLRDLEVAWQDRINSKELDSGYKDGVRDCFYELHQLVRKMSDTLYPEEIEYVPDDELIDKQLLDFLYSGDADDQLSSLSAHETI